MQTFVEITRLIYSTEFTRGKREIILSSGAEKRGGLTQMQMFLYLRPNNFAKSRIPSPLADREKKKKHESVFRFTFSARQFGYRRPLRLIRGHLSSEIRTCR